jgi:carbohydrate-selective porin OprB
VFVQPDLQYVLNPDTDPSIDDAVVVGVRIEAAFGYSSGD